MMRDDERLRDEDAAARRAARTLFDRPIALEAGAGTGKTTALVSRVVNWCVGPGWEKAERTLRGDGADDPSLHDIATRVASRVVAITFTEAAAAEMANRILRAIGELAADRPRSERMVEDALPEPAIVRQRSAALLGAIDRITVRTFHGFCHRLLSAHPLEAGLHPAFRIAAQRIEIDALANRVVESALRAASGREVAPDDVAPEGEWIGPGAICAALADLLDAGVQPEDLAQAAYDARACAALLEPLRRAVADAKAPFAPFAAAKRGDARNVPPALDRTNALLASPAPPDAVSLGARIDELRDIWGERSDRAVRGKLRKFAAGEFGQEENKLATDPAAVVRAAGPLAEAVDDVLSEEPERFEAVRAQLVPLLVEATAALRREGIVTFEALQRHARDLLVQRADVAARVRAGIDLLLVDEFQDTDPVQCELVRLLALGPEAGERPSLFLVGDPKQSVYGWRRADLASYQDMVERIIAAGGERFVLSVNYRSVPPVLREVERVTSSLLVHRPGEQAGFQPLLAARDSSRDSGFDAGGRAPVEHWLDCELDADRQAVQTLSSRAAGLEAATIAQEIEWLHRVHGVAWRDVALLFRAFGDAEGYLFALRRRGVPYEITKDRSHYQRREVIEATSLVRCVLDPNDALALVSWLRSVSGGIPDAAWTPLWSRRFPERMAMLDGPAPGALAELRALLDEVAASLDPAEVPGLESVRDWPLVAFRSIEGIARLRQSFAMDPVDVFVERLVVVGGQERLEAGRYLARHRLANLDRFHRELLGLLATGADPAAVLRALREGASENGDPATGTPGEAAADAVQVLTIHGAKGLQFRHVYCVQLHKQRSNRSDRHVAEVGDLDGRRVFSLCRIPGPGFTRHQRVRRRREDEESKRLLYVAMTRAQDRLVLAGIHPSFQRKRVKNSGALIEHVEPRVTRAGAIERMTQEMAGDPALARFAHDDVSWVIPARTPLDPVRRGPEPAAGAWDLAPIRAGVALLAAKREEAERTRNRRRLVPASAHRPDASDGRGVCAESDSHEFAIEARQHDEPRFDFDSMAHADLPGPLAFASSLEFDNDHDADRTPSTGSARAIGSAVHRALERMPFDIAPDEPGVREPLESVIEATLAGLLPVPDPAAHRRALELLDRALAPDGLTRVLRAKASAVVARELPVLMPLAGTASIVVGTIDLLYRDRASGALVVADWKTDRVAEGDLSERAERYRSQGALYVEAARRALGDAVAPRFELWFLDAGRVVSLDLGETAE